MSPTSRSGGDCSLCGGTHYGQLYCPYRCGHCTVNTGQCFQEGCDRNQRWRLEQEAAEKTGTIFAELRAAASEKQACKATPSSYGGGAAQDQRWNCEDCGDVTDTARCPMGRQNETLAALTSRSSERESVILAAERIYSDALSRVGGRSLASMKLDMEQVRAALSSASASREQHPPPGYFIAGWLRGHEFIGLPEHAKPGDAPLYCRRSEGRGA